MRLLAVHPSGLMYTRVFLTLEPLGLELVAGAARAAGHDVRIVDLQVERPGRLWRLIDKWRPDAVCLSGNYLANVPEIIDTAKSIKTRLPGYCSSPIMHGQCSTSCRCVRSLHPLPTRGRSMCTSRRDDAGVLWTMRQSSLSMLAVSVLVRDERNGTVRDAG